MSGVDVPLELRPPDITYNFQSQRGAPISAITNVPPGSDGRMATGLTESGSYNVPTANQFAGLAPFGGVAAPTNSSRVAQAAQLNGANPFSASLAADMQLPRALSNDTVILVLRRLQIGAPYQSRQVTHVFGSLVEAPKTDERGALLAAVKETYWLPEPYSTTGHTNSGYYWSPHARQVFAIQAGPVRVTWRKAGPYAAGALPAYANPGGGPSFETNGTSIFLLYTETYVVSGSAIKPPRTMYWTEKEYRYLGTPVSIPSARLGGVNIVYNNNFPRTVPTEYHGPGYTDPTEGGTNAPLPELRTFWYDQSQGFLYAYNHEGRVFLELLGDAKPDGRSRHHLGFEIVDVLRQPTPADVSVELGERLEPPGAGSADQWAPDPVLEMAAPAYTYQHTDAASGHRHIYAQRATEHVNACLVHWMAAGLQDILWPTVLGRYRLDWPADEAKYSHYLRPPAVTEAEAQRTAVQLQTENVPTIAYQDPLDRPRAALTADFKFYTWLDEAHPAHRTLLRFSAGQHVAFERVFSWLDAGLRELNVNPPNFTSGFGTGAAGGADYGNAKVSDGFLHLTEAQSTDGGSYVLDDFVSGQLVEDFRATFNIRLGGGSAWPADGFSFNFGTPPDFGYTTGVVAQPMFNSPRSLARDSAGNLYMADHGNHCIRKITPGGVVTTLAGSGARGSQDGSGTAARFDHPIALTMDSAGNLWVADEFNHRIRKVTPAGVVTTVAGTGAAGFADGEGGVAQFYYPSGVAVDGASGFRVLADSVADWSTNGTQGANGWFYGYYNKTADGTPGYQTTDFTRFPHDGGGWSATDYWRTDEQWWDWFNGNPPWTGLGQGWAHPNGASNGGEHWVVLRWVSTTHGTLHVDWRLAKKDSGGGGVSGHVFHNGVLRDTVPIGGTDSAGVYRSIALTNVAVGDVIDLALTPVGPSGDTGDGVDGTWLWMKISSGAVYVADDFNHRIRRITPAGVVTTLAGSGTPDGVVTTLAGSGARGFADGPGAAARFNLPRDVAVDGMGNVYVADAYNDRIRKIAPNGAVTTLAGSGTAGYADGAGAAAQFDQPVGVAVDGTGNVYVADAHNHRVRKVTPAGVVTTLAGSGTAGYADGTGNAAQFNVPHGVALDSAGNVLVVDHWNHRIRKVTPAGVVTTLAGSGTAGDADGTGSAAQFYLPVGVAVDRADNVWVVDRFNHRIRLVTPSGVVTTVAGSSRGYADGAGSVARFNWPRAVVVDSTGNVWVSDQLNHRIRKIATNGVVSTLAGSGTAGFADGTGGTAQFNNPLGIVLDGTGNIYVADGDNHRIRKVTPSGVVTTVSGSSQGFANGLRGAAQFSTAFDVAVDSAGNLLVADDFNHRLRKVTFGLATTTAAGSGTPGYADSPGAGSPVILGWAAEEGFADGLAVCFDSWDNDTQDNAPGITIKFNGSQVGGRATAGRNVYPDPSLQPALTDPATGEPLTLATGSAFVPVEILLRPSGTMDVSYKGVKVLANVATGYTPRTGQFALAARTSGQDYSAHAVDDLRIIVNEGAPVAAPIFAGSVVTNLESWLGNGTIFWPEVSVSPRVVNETVFVGDRIDAPAGEPGASGYLAGHIDTNIGTLYHPGAYVDPLAQGFAAANGGAIIPVNAIPGANRLEVWWFRTNSAHAGPNAGNAQLGFAPILWPTVLGRYTIEWPANPREIVLASKLGSGTLDPMEALGTIYRQNDRALPGYNPNEEHALIQQIDRTTVPELSELAAAADAVQTGLDNAEGGLSPLGIPEGGLALDINPNAVVNTDNGTHFEQVYGRAKTALNNAVASFDDAKNVTRLMRSEQDSLTEVQAGVARQELAFNNALIELYGSPYPDDIGAGKTWTQGYAGPDLIHYQYVDTPELTFGGLANPAQPAEFRVDIQNRTADYLNGDKSRFDFVVRAYNNDKNYLANTQYVSFTLDAHGFLAKPATWRSQRASPGKIQEAIADIVLARNNALEALASNETLKYRLDRLAELFQARLEFEERQHAWDTEVAALKTAIDTAVFAAKMFKLYNDTFSDGPEKSTEAVLNAIPDVAIAGTSVGGDLAPAAMSSILAAYATTKATLTAANFVKELIVGAATLTQEGYIRQKQAMVIGPLLRKFENQQEVYELDVALGDLQLSVFAINRKVQELDAAFARYRALIAEGDRLQEERQIFRQRAAAVVQGYRTRDAAFRLFRNEKLERYKTLFDLAARYSLLAANAYDYETGLLGTSAGRDFKKRIINARALGVVRNGEPQYAGSNTGDPGLSSALAEMKADWDVLRGRLGFNNPDAYGTTVSLRTEALRILPTSDSDANWQDVLQAARKADLLEDADVRRYCMQIDDGSGLPVPGLVLTFSTTIADGYNLFGRELAAGDHAFSSGSFATKVFGVGVALVGYRGMDDPTAGATSGGTSPPDPPIWYLDPLALSATPYIYLIPVGVDSMRTPPLGDARDIRTWTVDDLAIPMPFNIGASEFSTRQLWQSDDSLTEPLFAVRKHQAFRPVSTTSVFSPSLYGDTGSLRRSQFTSNRLVGRSVWNSQWKLVIPGRTLLNDPNAGLDRFIQTVTDIRLHFVTYSYSGN